MADIGILIFGVVAVLLEFSRQIETRKTVLEFLGLVLVNRKVAH